MSHDNGKLKVRDIMGLEQALAELGAVTILPIGIGLKVARMAKRLSDEIALVYDQRNALVKKYAKGKSRIEETDAEWGPFQEDLRTLQDQPVPSQIDKVSIPSAVDGKNLVISVAALLKLDPFITIEEPIGEAKE